MLYVVVLDSFRTRLSLASVTVRRPICYSLVTNAPRDCHPIVTGLPWRGANPGERIQAAMRTNIGDCLVANPSSRFATDEPGWLTPEFPADLRDWSSPSMLLDWVEQEIARLMQQSPGLLQGLRAHPDSRPAVLLRLLSFAYSSAIFSSEETVRS